MILQNVSRKRYERTKSCRLTADAIPQAISHTMAMRTRRKLPESLPNHARYALNKAMIHPNKLLNTFCMLSRILSKTIDNCVINTVFNGCSKNASPTGTGTVQNKKRDSALLPIPQHKDMINCDFYLILQ